MIYELRSPTNKYLDGFGHSYITDSSEAVRTLAVSLNACTWKIQIIVVVVVVIIMDYFLTKSN